MRNMDVLKRDKIDNVDSIKVIIKKSKRKIIIRW